MGIDFWKLVFVTFNDYWHYNLNKSRDLADFGMGMNRAPPVMSREEFEARKADLRRKREMERRGER